MAYSYSELEGIWVRAGGKPDAAPLMAAIALAESAGNPDAHNPRPPDDSYGLWQINMLGQMGIDRAKAYGLSSYTQLYDPVTNAKAAIAISGNGTNFVPWSTFTNGAYKPYLQGGVPPNLNGDYTNPGGGAGGVENAGFTTPSDVISNLWNGVILVGNYVYFGIVVLLGLVFMYMGFMILIRETSGGQAVGSTGRVIKKVIPGV